MAYSVTGIVNLALSRIGVKGIANLSEQSQQAIAANASWQYIRDEVLSAKDWYFAKKRVALAQNATSPAYNFDYAYTLPADFLRLCKQDSSDASVFPSGYYAEDSITGQVLIQNNYTAYKIEAISDGTLCLVTNYDNSSYDIYINYIAKITDVTKFSPQFISALAFRLAAELSITRTETRSKFTDMMETYRTSLVDAEGHNMSMDYNNGETGTDSWLMAGR